MTTPGNRLALLLSPLIVGLLFSASAMAECGGNQQCIAVSINPSVAPRHGTPETSSPLTFGNQRIGTGSASRPILAAAVSGPVGTRATLTGITLQGANSADFRISSTTCSVGGASLLHDGAPQAALTNSCRIRVVFSPTGAGVRSASIAVRTSVITRTIPLSGTGTSTQATAASTRTSVVANQPKSINLGRSVSGSNLLGIRITTPPANGTAAVSGFQVTYTPAEDFIGSDSFSYVSFNSGGASAPAKVTLTVSPRDDPSEDPTVIGLVEGQTGTVRRFTRAQTFNYQRRMEALRRPRAGGSETADGWQSGAGVSPSRGVVGAFESKRRARRELGLTGAQGGTAPLEHAAVGGEVFPTSVLASVLSATTTQSLSFSGSDTLWSLPGGTGFWLSGSLQFGSRSQSSAESALDFRTDGVSGGMDRWFGDKLALGLGAGYARDDTDIGLDGSKSRSTGWSVSGYGTYLPTPNTFIDALIGYGVSSHDTDRFVSSVNTFARGERTGEQLFGSIGGGYDYRRNGYRLSPYGRLDVAHDRLAKYTESGAGNESLTYFEEDFSTIGLAFGLNAESTHRLRSGWVRPRLLLEYRRELEDTPGATIAFASQPGGPTFSVTPSGENRDSMRAGIGADFISRRGLEFGVDYSFDPLSNLDRNQALRFWLSKRFDAPTESLVGPTSELLDNPVRVQAGYTWDDNINRSAVNELSDHVYSLDASQSLVFPLTSHTRGVARGLFKGQKLQTIDGLDRISGGIHAELQYRPSGAFGAPTFGVFGRSTYDAYESTLRDGLRHSLGLNLSMPLSDRLFGFAAVSANHSDADSSVFSGTDYSAKAHFDLTVDRHGTAYLSGEYRRGDAVTSDDTILTRDSVSDDAYGDRGLFASRYEAETVVFTVGYNWALGPRDSIDVSWRRVHSTPDASQSYVGAYGGGGDPPSYKVNQYSVFYLMRF